MSEKINCKKCDAKILVSTFERNDGLCEPCTKQIKKKLALKEWQETPGCPACDGTDDLQIRWEKRRMNPERSKYEKFLKLKSSFGSGWMFYCISCSQKWYLERNKKNMYKIPKKPSKHDEKILEKWKNKELRLKNSQMAFLKKIGAVLNRGLEVPCEVLTKDGKTYPKAIIVFQSIPLFDSDDLSVDKILKIKTSPFALSKKIRQQTILNMNDRDGWEGTPVVSTSGEMFYLQGRHRFFNHEKTKGSELKLVDIDLMDDYKSSYTASPFVASLFQYFVADYSEGVEKFLKWR